MATKIKGKPTLTVVGSTNEKVFRTKSIVKARKYARSYGGHVVYA